MPAGKLRIPTPERLVQFVNVAADWVTAIQAIEASNCDTGVILLNASITITGAENASTTKNIIVAQGNKPDTGTGRITLTIGNGWQLAMVGASDFQYIKFINLDISRGGNGNGVYFALANHGLVEFIGCSIVTTGGGVCFMVQHQFDGSTEVYFGDCTININATGALMTADQNAARLIASCLKITFSNCHVVGGVVARLNSGDCQVEVEIYNSVIRLGTGTGLWEIMVAAPVNGVYRVRQDSRSSVGQEQQGLGAPFVTFSYLEAVSNVIHSAAGPVTVYGGFCYTNRGAVGAITFNLPATAPDGYQVSFVVMAAQNMIIQAGAGDTIDIATTSSSVAGTATANAVYSRLTLEALGDGAGNIRWVAKESLGSWVLA